MRILKNLKRKEGENINKDGFGPSLIGNEKLSVMLDVIDVIENSGLRREDFFLSFPVEWRYYFVFADWKYTHKGGDNGKNIWIERRLGEFNQ